MGVPPRPIDIIIFNKIEYGMKWPNKRRIFRSIKSPKLFFREINRIFFSLKLGKWNNRGIDFFDQDWDNLIILDACRFDTYENCFDFSGEINKKYRSCGVDCW